MTDTLITGQYLAAHASDESMIGVALGNYRITDALSGGGMGRVYRAQHEILDRPAAIKLLRPEFTENDDLVQRFFNEAKAATAIRHPGIVEVYDFGYTDAGNAYIVMEFLDGVPLARAVEERGQFPETEAASITRSIASALKAAHAKGIIHRDLKPDNVFLIPDPDGREARVKVLDFGIAKLANLPASDRRRTQTGVLMGTPKYMAPEQAREAATIDQRADLYSLGCMLYELLVGRPPFDAEGAGEVIALQMFTEPEPPSKYVPVSPEMEAIVMRLLAKEPKDRYQTAAELMDALVVVGARMSGPREVISVQSTNNMRVSHLDTLPAMSSAEITLRTPPVANKRSWTVPAVLAGLVIAAIAATIVIVVTRESDTPPAPAAPIAAPSPTPVQPATTPPPAPVPTPVAQQLVTPPPAPPPVEVKKKPSRKAAAKIEPGAGKRVLAPEAPSAPSEDAPPSKPITDKGSPIETGLEDSPKKTP